MKFFFIWQPLAYHTLKNWLMGMILHCCCSFLHTITNDWDLIVDSKMHPEIRNSIKNSLESSRGTFDFFCLGLIISSLNKYNNEKNIKSWIFLVAKFIECFGLFEWFSLCTLLHYVLMVDQYNESRWSGP